MLDAAQHVECAVAGMQIANFEQHQAAVPR